MVEKKRRILVLDTAYTYETLIKRKLTKLITSKSVNGYFEHVSTVHAVASVFSPSSCILRYGRPVVRELEKGHTHIEGKIGRFKLLRLFPFLNFIFAQIDLIWFLLKLIKKNNISIIRAEDFLFNGILGFLIASLKKKPLVIGVWSNHRAIRKDTKKTISPYLKWIWLENIIEGFILRRANLVFCGTEYYRSFVLSHGVLKEKTVLSRFGNAIATEHFLAPNKREKGYSEFAELGIIDEKVVMLISRLEMLKRPDHVIKALACIRAKDLRIKLLLAGDGAAKELITILAEKLGVSNQIVFCGDRDQDWLLRTIPCASVIVSPTTGRALTEAALGGAPIVAYNTDWQNEIIEHGVTGELVPDLDYSAMAFSIEKILRNKKYARMIGTNVRKQALKIMDPQNIHNEIEKAYEKLLAVKSIR